MDNIPIPEPLQKVLLLAVGFILGNVVKQNPTPEVSQTIDETVAQTQKGVSQLICQFPSPDTCPLFGEPSTQLGPPPPVDTVNITQSSPPSAELPKLPEFLGIELPPTSLEFLSLLAIFAIVILFFAVAILCCWVISLKKSQKQNEEPKKSSFSSNRNQNPIGKKYFKTSGEISEKLYEQLSRVSMTKTINSSQISEQCILFVDTETIPNRFPEDEWIERAQNIVTQTGSWSIC
jgi:hypothetical protein